MRCFAPDLIWLWPDGDRSRDDTDSSHTRQIGLSDHPLGGTYRNIAQPATPLSKKIPELVHHETERSLYISGPR